MAFLLHRKLIASEGERQGMEDIESAKYWSFHSNNATRHWNPWCCCSLSLENNQPVIALWKFDKLGHSVFLLLWRQSAAIKPLSFSHTPLGEKSVLNLHSIYCFDSTILLHCPRHFLKWVKMFGSNVDWISLRCNIGRTLYEKIQMRSMYSE